MSSTASQLQIVLHPRIDAWVRSNSSASRCMLERRFGVRARGALGVAGRKDRNRAGPDDGAGFRGQKKMLFSFIYSLKIEVFTPQTYTISGPEANSRRTFNS